MTRESAKRISLLCLWLAVLAGILLRTVDLSLPDLSTDEAQYALGSRSHPFVGIGLIQIAQQIFGSSIPIVRSVSVLAGTLTLFLLYATMRFVFPKEREAAFLSLVTASLFTSHIILSRLAYLDAMQCLAWVLLLYVFLRTRERQTTLSVTALFLAGVLVTFVKVQGMLFPFFLLSGRFLERRGRVIDDPLFGALLLSLVPFGMYMFSQPEVLAILFLYTGDVIGFIDLPGRLLSLLDLWRDILGVLLLLVPISLWTFRRFPWPVVTLLLLAIGINFFLSARLYYSTYMVFFALPIGLLLSLWPSLFRHAALLLIFFSALLIAGPHTFPFPGMRFSLLRNPGYWNTHAQAINESLGDIDSVIAIGHIGHQVRWYIDTRVLSGNAMDTRNMPGTFLVVAPPGVYAMTGAELLYSDERVQVLRR